MSPALSSPNGVWLVGVGQETRGKVSPYYSFTSQHPPRLATTAATAAGIFMREENGIYEVSGSALLAGDRGHNRVVCGVVSVSCVSVSWWCEEGCRTRWASVCLACCGPVWLTLPILSVPGRRCSCQLPTGATTAHHAGALRWPGGLPASRPF